jgi:hypothetical protein
MSFYSERRGKARKQHRCFGCWFKSDTNPIIVGAYYWRIRTADGGEYSSYALCEACHSHLETNEGKAFLDECSDGYMAGDILTDRIELAKRSQGLRA